MFILGRVYILSMLLNLNNRVSGNEGSSQGTSRIRTRGRDRGTISFAHDTSTSCTGGLGGLLLEWDITEQCKTPTHVLLRALKISVQSMKSPTVEDPPAEIEMTATNSSKIQSELLVV
ncbi:hypothetical protein K438DRAFT_1765794 [Mycena galopus ATCC 62051]|nr:hypothetical protein K438DRAFT_1765794 [Mycena galopus ATCC 62051]